jgi:hypothetical protein
MTVLSEHGSSLAVGGTTPRPGPAVGSIRGGPSAPSAVGWLRWAAAGKDLVANLYGPSSGNQEPAAATDILPADRAAFEAHWQEGEAVPMNGLDQAMAGSGTSSGNIVSVTVNSAEQTLNDATDATVQMNVTLSLEANDGANANPQAESPVTLQAQEIGGLWYIAYPWAGSTGWG